MQLPEFPAAQINEGIRQPQELYDRLRAPFEDFGKGVFDVYANIPFPLYFVNGQAVAGEMASKPTRLGTQVWDRIGIQIPNNEKNALSLKAGSGEPTANYFLMPDTTVVDLQKYKKIEETVMSGDLTINFTGPGLATPKDTSLSGSTGPIEGTVKEYISTENWQVRFFGWIINYEKDEMPMETMVNMDRLFSINRSLNVTSKLLNDLGIFSIVSTGIRFPPSEGVQNAARFELFAIADQPIELVIS